MAYGFRISATSALFESLKRIVPEASRDAVRPGASTTNVQVVVVLGVVRTRNVEAPRASAYTRRSTPGKAEEMSAQALLNAARTLSQDPVAVQIRFMQTLSEMTGSKTTVLPIPVDLISNFINVLKKPEDKT